MSRCLIREKCIECIPPSISHNQRVVSFRLLGRGRFKEEFNYVVLMDGQELCRMKVFCGRGFYKPWIELYSFTEIWGEVKGDEDLLLRILKFFREVLDVDESLYIEYYHDDELVRTLERGVDIEETWIGRLLVEAGFKKFRDWYIPEGMWEGGQKIEARP